MKYNWAMAEGARIFQMVPSDKCEILSSIGRLKDEDADEDEEEDAMPGEVEVEASGLACWLTVAQVSG